MASIAKGFKNFPVVEKFKGNAKLIVAGSTWKPDEELLAEFINQNSEAKIIFAPHEVSEANINRLTQLLKKPVVRFSQIENVEVESVQVIIVDSIGILSSLYKYGEIAYIGGGFGVGIHNILEAATFGLPVIFGPNYQKFKEAVDLKSEGGAFSITDFNQLQTIMNRLLNNVDALIKASEISKNYVENLHKADPELQQDILAESIKIWQTDRLGYTEPDGWINMQQVLLDMALLEEPLDLEEAYTNDLLP